MTDLLLVVAFGLIVFSPCLLATLVLLSQDDEDARQVLRRLLCAGVRPVRRGLRGLSMAVFAPVPRPLRVAALPAAAHVRRRRLPHLHS